MDLDLLEVLKKRDYLKKDNYFEVDKEVESVLVYGQHYEKTPEVTIIMPTFKRTDLLPRAIKSILDQEGYDDYQLLIVDNEPVFDEETETEKVVKSFNSDKIIYYKNKVNVGIYGNWTRCVELAKSKYVCMCHDDDLLVKNHLKIMMEILHQNPDIKYLSCKHKYLDARVEFDVDLDEKCKKADESNITLTNYTFYDFSDDFVTLYLGAVFDRECAMDIGGFMPRATLLEEYIFAAKMAYYYNVYECNLPLYVYYWGNNTSLKKTSIWGEISVHQYLVMKYIANTREEKYKKLFNDRARFMIIDKVRSHINGTSFLNEKCDIDINEFAKHCGFKSAKYSIISRKINSFKVLRIEKKRIGKREVRKVNLNN
jgi:glycosyltransferase involved in cell wall biosynthesis